MVLLFGPDALCFADPPAGSFFSPRTIRKGTKKKNKQEKKKKKKSKQKEKKKIRNRKGGKRKRRKKCGVVCSDFCLDRDHLSWAHQNLVHWLLAHVLRLRKGTTPFCLATPLISAVFIPHAFKRATVCGILSTGGTRVLTLLPSF